MRPALFVAGAAMLAAVFPACAGDAEAGKVVYGRCAPCHDAVNATNKVGPHLVGIVGQPAGAVEGFRYSPSLRELAETGLTWDEATLARFLKKPREVVPRTSMAFAGMPNDEDIANVIEFLKVDPKP